MKSVQPIMEEIRRLAEERRGLSPPATMPATADPSRFEAADLRRPMRIPEAQRLRWLVATLDRLRRRALQAVLIQQSELNKRLSLEGWLLSQRLETAAEERLALEETLDGLRWQIEQLRADLHALQIEARRTAGSRDGDEVDAAAVDGAPAPLPATARRFYEDPIYFQLETQMRGDEDTIRDRQRIYVERFRAAADAGGAMVLDVGCGRGEFLELLRDAGLPACGVDLSPDNVKRCREKNLHVVQGDGLAYLTAQPAQSVAGVFASHVVEHVKPDYLLALVRACFDTVRPNGCVVLETLNPDSLAAMTIFHADLSHARPIPPATGRLLLEACGFRHVETLYLSPYPDGALLPIGEDASPLARQVNHGFTQLNQLLFAPREYALVATR